MSLSEFRSADGGSGQFNSFSSTASTGAGAEGLRRRSDRDPVLELVIGDITCEGTEAIVNPAGPGLVDLSVRRAAGPQLLDAFHQAIGHFPEGRLPPGQAVLTPGFQLLARHVIHTSSPVYADDPARAREELASCHIEALRLARENKLSSVALPAIGTGVFRYPAREAAEVAVSTIVAELRKHGAPLHVRLVLFTAASHRTYTSAATVLLNQDPINGEAGARFNLRPAGGWGSDGSGRRGEGRDSRLLR